ncbi:MAG: FG-GAP-like repeat-containing protein [Chitinophagales bacterium]
MKKRAKTIVVILISTTILTIGLGFTYKGKIVNYVKKTKSPGVQATAKEIEPLPWSEGASGNQAMIDYLNDVFEIINNPHCKFMNKAILQNLLAQPIPEDPDKRFDWYFDVISQCVNSGQLDDALHFITTYEASDDFQKINKKQHYKWYTGTGITYLRYGEIKNCIANHNAQSCIWPLSEMARHTDKFGARKAIESYSKALDIKPDDLSSIWLMNIAYMQLGEYPQNVPSKYLIPESSFQSEDYAPKFQNIAGNLGLDYADMCGAVIMDDFNNDQLIDIFQAGWGLNEEVHLMLNTGDGKFEDATTKAGLKNYPGGLMMMQTDYNNDNNLDIFILRGAWHGVFGIIPNSLLRNNGDGTFTDVTYETGLFSCHPTQTATWADFNNDGWLDLFIGNEASKKGDTRNDCELYINDHGMFKNVAAEAGANKNSFIKGVTSGDYDNDGDPDIYISANGFKNYLLRNDTKKGTMQLKFTDVSEQAGVKGPMKSFPCMFFDYNNDGWLDILNFSYSANVSDNDIPAEYLKQPRVSDLTALYLNNKNGTFTNIASEAGLDRTFLVMGCNYGDYDMDGWIDFYTGTGKPSLRSLIPNRLFRNDAGTFKEVTTSTGTGHLQKGHGVSFADLNNDGYPEIFAQMGGAFDGDGFQDCLFENPATFGNNFICIDLEGTITNKKAIGARIKIMVEENGSERTIYDWVTHGSSFGANSLRQELGLGKATVIKKLEINWPTSGSLQVFENISANQHIKITENENGYTVLNLLPFKFFVPENPIQHDHGIMIMSSL